LRLQHFQEKLFQIYILSYAAFTHGGLTTRYRKESF